MTYHYLVGVDGGGTHCRARLIDGEGQVLSEGTAGSANVRLGDAAAWASISKAVTTALSMAGLDRSAVPVTRLGLGLAGALCREDRDGVLARARAEGFASVHALTDAHAAVLGAFDGGDGAILILGTGSCGMLHRCGRFTSVGGWGFPASDQASGARLGLEAVRAALLAHDGLGAETPLTRRVMEKIGPDALAVSWWQRQARPRDFAGLVPLVFTAAESGDKQARRLLETSASDADAMLDRLFALGASACALLGGLGPRLAPYLRHDRRERLVEPQGDAMDGALLMAQYDQGAGATCPGSVNRP